MIADFDCCAGYTLEKKSSLIAVGLTVHSTPVDVREQLAIPEVGNCRINNPRARIQSDLAYIGRHLFR